MRFEWDENKRLINIKKHGLDFNDVTVVFEDIYSYTKIDNRKNYGEIRYMTVGMVNKTLLTSVCHTDRNGNIRVISFRPASKKEREVYYERKNS